MRKMKVYGFRIENTRHVMAAPSKATMAIRLEANYGIHFSQGHLNDYVCETGNESELKATKSPFTLCEVQRNGELVPKMRRPAAN